MQPVINYNPSLHKKSWTKQSQCKTSLNQHNLSALLPGWAFLVIFSWTLLFVDSLLDSSWNTDTLQLRDTVTLLILDGVTLFPGILCSFTILSVLDPTLLPWGSLLNGSLGDLTLTLLNIGTDRIGNISALFLSYRFIGGLGNLIANLFWNLSANWFRSSSWSRTIGLQRHIHKRQ